MARLRRLRWLLAAAVACLAIGCSPTPDAADLVAEQALAGQQVGRTAAVAAMRDYFDAVNEALETGDVDDLAAMTGTGCPCRELVAFIDDRFAGGAELVGASFDVEEVSVVGREARRAEVRTQVTVSEYDIRNADGLLVGSRPSQRFVATYTLVLRDDAWSVVDVRQETAVTPDAGP